MPLRRSLAATAAAVLTAVPLLASCGFSNNTGLVYTPATGTDDRSGAVDVLSAVVVSSAEGEGTFIATLSNNDRSEPATFESVQGAEGNTVVPGDAEPLEIPPGGFVNLADGGGVKLSGSFTVGDTIPLAIGFDGGSDVELVVPVVRACEEYAGLDPAADDSSTSASPSSSASLSSSSSAQEPGESSAASATSEESDEAEADPYACATTEDEQE